LTRTEAIVVLDCGATNLRSIVVGRQGELLAEASRPNSAVPQPGNPTMKIWDLGAVFTKLCSATKEALGGIRGTSIEGVTVATWGADGAPVKGDGSLAYPVISWQCGRTEALARDLGREIDPWKIYGISGYQVMAINTLFKLMWLREHAPRSLQSADYWLMMPGLVEAELGADPHVDPTSASTTMAMDLRSLDWSEELLDLAGLDPGFFPPWKYPGEITGTVSGEASAKSGIPAGTPIVAGGHDTQFALVGSGASRGEAILSSGTWEIAAIRSESFTPTRSGFEGGVIFESDAVKGWYDPQILMMGSGVLEWLRANFFADIPPGDYASLIDMGSRAAPGAGGVVLVPSFVSDSGPTRRFGTRGTLLGLELSTTRGEIYRAALEGLSYQLRHALEVLTDSTGMEPESLRVVGGGSKNDLWNRIRADVTQLPVSTTSQKEATVVGAAMVALVGLGVLPSLDQAVEGLDVEITSYHPGPDADFYEDRYRAYREVPVALQPAYADAQRD
jgi:L-fuculokinase